MPVIKNTKEIDGNEITLYIEVDKIQESESVYKDLRDGKAREMARKAIQTTDDIFGEGLELASNCAKLAVDSFKQMTEQIRPDEIEVRFAIKLGGEAGAAIVEQVIFL